MRRSSLMLLACCVILASTIAGAAAGAPANPKAPAQFVRINEPVADGTMLELSLTGLWPGDRLMVTGAGAAALQTGSTLPWLPLADDNNELAWQVDIAATPAVQLLLATDALLPGQEVVVSIERAVPDGSVARASRALRRDEKGQLLLGPETFARIGHRIKLQPAPENDTTGLATDGKGLVELSMADPRLPALLAGATETQPFVTADVASNGTWKILDSVTDDNQRNEGITNRCSTDPYLGTAINIGAAPPTAEITSLDLSYQVYHPNGIDEFRVAVFYNRSYGRVLYGGDGNPALTTLTVNSTNLATYTGKYVNAEYILGTCAINPPAGGNLDYWSITLYYDPPTGTIDIVADSLVLSSPSVSAGANATFAYNVHLDGSGSTGGSYIIGFYLSSDNNITVGDTLLSQLTESTATDAGDTISVSGYSVPIPGATAAGTYYLGMIVDSAGAINEATESNNTSWVQLTVTSGGATIDLVAGSVAANTGTVPAGGDVMLTYSGSVAGSGTVGSYFDVGIYLSADATITTADSLLSSITISAADSPGDTFGSSVLVPIPNGTTPGSYRLGILVDNQNAVNESTEGNNTASTALSVTAAGAGADLVAAALVPAAGLVQPGDSLEVKHLTLVSGSGTLHGTFRIQFLLSEDETITTADTSLLTLWAISLTNPGETYGSQNESIKIPVGQAPGSYYLGMFVDSTDNITEASDANNIIAVPLTVLSGVLYVPAAAHTAGVGGSSWRSDLEVRALDNKSASFSVALLEKDSNNASPQEQSAWVGAGQTRRFNDVIGDLFGFDGAAALRITPVNGRIMVTSRTYNDDPGGTYGQYIAGYPDHEAISFGEEAAIIQLSRSPNDNEGYRTNLGMVNVTDGWIRIRVQLFLASGATLGAAFSYDLPPYGFKQISDIFGKRLDDWINDGFATVWTTTPDGAFFAYASVVDNKSGDAVYIPAQTGQLAKAASTKLGGPTGNGPEPE